MKHKTLLSAVLPVFLTALMFPQPIHAQAHDESLAKTLTGRIVTEQIPAPALEGALLNPSAPGDGGSDYVPGTDITAQLRDDLSAGLDVQLPSGTFYVSESIIIEEYSGTIAGAGKDTTIIEAAQGFKATTDPFPLFTSNETFTEIITIYLATGDVTFRDMTILVTGDAPAEQHNNKWHPGVTTIDNVFWVGGVSPNAGSEVTVTMENLRIKGEDSSDPGSVNGKNMIYVLGIYGQVFAGYSAYKPLNGVVKNCQIENAGEVAIEYWRVNGGSAEITDNEILNSHSGIFVQQGINALEIANNVFQNIATDPIARGSGISDYCAMNNTLNGMPMTDDCETASASEPQADVVLPQDFALAQNYPNPFNPTTTISYSLPHLADVTLTVYDLLGRPVRVLASGMKPAGTYAVTFDASGLSSGLYLYRLQAGTYVETKRMVVVR